MVLLSTCLLNIYNIHIQYIYMHLYLLFLSKGVNTDEYRTPLAPDQEKRTSCIHYATEESPT